MQSSEAEVNDTRQAEAGPSVNVTGPGKRRRRLVRPRRRRWRMLSVLLFVGFDVIVVLGVTLFIASQTLVGRELPVPAWAVTEIARVLSRGLGTGEVEIGGAAFRIPDRALPQVVLKDVTLSTPQAGRLLSVPSLRVEIDKRAIWSGKVRIQEYYIENASLRLRRKADGTFDLGFGEGSVRAPFRSLDDIIQVTQTAFKLPALAPLRILEASNLGILYEDARVGRSWRISDGLLRLTQSDDSLDLSIDLKLPPDAAAPLPPGTAAARGGEMALRLTIGTTGPQAKASARIENLPAADIAAQSPALSWLEPLQAPVSGAVTVGRRPNGAMGRMDGTLAIGAGVLQPESGASPIPFDGAQAYFGYHPDQARITFDQLTVRGPYGQVSMTGHADLEGVRTGWPTALIGQFSFSDMRLDPPGFLVQPATFDSGALDVKVSLGPFRAEIGQWQISTSEPEGAEGRTQMLASGLVTADQSGWHVALDASIDQVRVDRLMALWPLPVVPRTREWIAPRLNAGEVFDAHAGFRFHQGDRPQLAVTFRYRNASLTPMATLPAVADATGYAAVGNYRFVTTLEAGSITPPEGGAIDVAGSSFRVADMREHPPVGEILLDTRSSVTAALSLLDQEPFRFLSDANQPVNMADGQLRASGRIAFPMEQTIGTNDVTFDVSGQAAAITSTVVVPGQKLTSEVADFHANVDGLRISGAGRLDDVPLDAVFKLPFGPQAAAPTVDGTVEIGKKFVDTFGIGLPQGSVTGAGQAQFSLVLPRAEAIRYRLESALRGVGLALPELDWSKSAGAEGSLKMAGRLGDRPTVDEMTLQANGLRAQGNVTTTADGGLDHAQFSRVAIGAWLDAPVVLTGRGRNQNPSVAVRGGWIDIRKTTLGNSASSGSSGPPLSIALNRLRISDGISLTDFRSDLIDSGGYAGNFSGSVNGQARVSGTVVPARYGTTIQVRSENAGAVFKAAGMFQQANGGDMTLTLQPRPEPSEYDGKLTVKNIRVRSASVLTALVNAISIVGLIDELSRAGFLFTDVEANFRLTPKYVQVKRASGAGPSLGISMEGVYDMTSDTLNMQGVFSPVYVLNFIGRILTRKGEGLIGFTYKLRGPSADPDVDVNPLSAFTPGMFREIFRAPPPQPKTGG